MEGTAGVIPCAADVALDDGTSRPISVTLVLNSVPLDIHAIQSDTRIFAHLTNNVVVGLLLVNAMASDSQTVLECVVMDGNTTVLSASTTFLIGELTAFVCTVWFSLKGQHCYTSLSCKLMLRHLQLMRGYVLTVTGNYMLRLLTVTLSPSIDYV